MSQYLIDVPDEKIDEVAALLETLNVKGRMIVDSNESFPSATPSSPLPA